MGARRLITFTCICLADAGWVGLRVKVPAIFVTKIELYWLSKTFPRRVRGTADPSTALRSGRDDKGGRGASIEDGIVAEGSEGHTRGLVGLTSRSLHYAPPDFLWNLVALVHFIRLSLTERRTRGLV